LKHKGQFVTVRKDRKTKTRNGCGNVQQGKNLSQKHSQRNRTRPKATKRRGSPCVKNLSQREVRGDYHFKEEIPKIQGDHMLEAETEPFIRRDLGEIRKTMTLQMPRKGGSLESWGREKGETVDLRVPNRGTISSQPYKKTLK